MANPQLQLKRSDIEVLDELECLLKQFIEMNDEQKISMETAEAMEAYQMSLEDLLDRIRDIPEN